jgi:membrane protein implicated in regulation of membrane protease activity
MSRTTKIVKVVAFAVLAVLLAAALRSYLARQHVYHPTRTGEVVGTRAAAAAQGHIVSHYENAGLSKEPWRSP